MQELLNKVEDGKAIDYKYYFNGLYIHSQIRIPEVSEYNGIEDGSGIPVINIQFGKVTETFPNTTYDNSVISISPDKVLINIEPTAKYLIEGTDTVIIEPYPAAPEEAVRLYILSIVLGVLLHKNGILALHASTIKVGDAAIAIAGHSGAGKSTLALSLYRKGYEVINDDITSVFFDEAGNPFIYPGVSHLKLWARSLQKYGYEVSEFDKLKEDLEKYSFPVSRATTSALPLKAVYILNEGNGSSIEHKVLTGLEKFQKAKGNTYRYKLVQHLQKTGNHFMLATKLANKVPFIKVTRTTDISPASFAEYMEEQFGKL